MPEKKAYLTTGQVAAGASVCPRTVTKWCDAGLLKFYRLPETGPKAGHRHILIESAVELFQKSGIPVPKEWLPDSPNSANDGEPKAGAA